MAKGKTRAAEIIGLTPEPLRPPPFHFPSIDVACHDSGKLWPKRISPNNLPIPSLYGQHAPGAMMLYADAGGQLGVLLLRLIEWITEPHLIDLTADESGTKFEPPPGTTVSPPGDIPTNILTLVAGGTAYSMCVHLVPSILCVGCI